MHDGFCVFILIPMSYSYKWYTRNQKSKNNSRCLGPPLLSGFFCAFHSVVPNSNLQHTNYAFPLIFYCTIFVNELREKTKVWPHLNKILDYDFWKHFYTLNSDRWGRRWACWPLDHWTTNLNRCWVIVRRVGTYVFLFDFTLFSPNNWIRSKNTYCIKCFYLRTGIFVQEWIIYLMLI